MSQPTCSVPDCTFTQTIVIANPPLCDGHYRRQRRHGSTAVTKMPTKGMSPMDRFMTKVEKGDGCWLWTARNVVTSSLEHPVVITYGRFKLPGGRNVLAHRWMYEQTHGASLTESEVVRHTCDVGLCVNPDHLLIGTQQDNVNDCIERGRAWWLKR